MHDRYIVPVVLALVAAVLSFVAVSASADGLPGGPGSTTSPTLVEIGPTGAARPLSKESSSDASTEGGLSADQLFDQGRITESAKIDGASLSLSTLANGEMCIRMSDRAGRSYTCASSERIAVGQLALRSWRDDGSTITAGVAPLGTTTVSLGPTSTTDLVSRGWVIASPKAESLIRFTTEDGRELTANL